MKKSIFAFVFSALIALAAGLPNVVHADTGLSSSSGSASVDKLNERLREQTKESGSMPDMKTLPKPHLPNRALHVTYLVETNKKGQVVRVRAGQPCESESFNDYTYYNAIQTFIRRTDGSATAGVFKLTYDYAPDTKLIKRDVSLVEKGGVNADAPGAVEVMEHESAAAEAKLHPKP